jgi:hypothetical protein
MKKIIILLFISNIVFAQNIAKKEVLEANLFKNWVADYAMLNGLRVEKMGQMLYSPKKYSRQLEVQCQEKMY